MALPPIDSVHALQIQAGTAGRKRGHEFEEALAAAINDLDYPLTIPTHGPSNLFVGNPALSLLTYLARMFGCADLQRASAISTGSLATSEEGQKWLLVNGVPISRCKSDLIVSLQFSNGKEASIGISTKQCNNKQPTNAQLYFTTARGFVNLLRNNGIAVSDAALFALRQFCGDGGFKPSDNAGLMAVRDVDPRRFFWEEIDDVGLAEWEWIFTNHQDAITRLLLQKAYLDDPFVPEVLLHKTKKAESWSETEVAIFSIDELVMLSRRYQGYVTRPYSVRKGSYKDPIGTEHLAPRFGVVQMQRGGQAQHPEQLQFNLECGYFYKI